MVALRSFLGSRSLVNVLPVPNRPHKYFLLFCKYVRNNAVISNSQFVLFPSNQPFKKRGRILRSFLQFFNYLFGLLVIELLQLAKGAISEFQGKCHIKDLGPPQLL